jgi:hypothetical protein
MSISSLDFVRTVLAGLYELAANGRFVGLEFFAYDDKASLGFPVPKFKAKFSDAVDCIDGLPLRDLLEPALEVTRQSRHHDVRQSALFEKLRNWSA